MAKGAEDTATYRYRGLLSHAEVGLATPITLSFSRCRSSTICQRAQLLSALPECDINA